MSKDKQASLLRVGEALSRDVGRGVVRIDPDAIARLGIGVGSFVRVGAIAGPAAPARWATCKVMPTFPEQRGQGRAHLDGLARENAALAIDAPVCVEPIEPAEAERVTIMPRTVSVAQRDLAYIGSLLDGLPVTEGDAIRANLFGSRAAEFVVRRSRPHGPVVITPSTRLTVEGGEQERRARAAPASYEDIGGLGHQLGRVREMIELPLRRPELFSRLGIDPPRGVLLHGPPGTGKTLIARTIAHEADAAFFTISGPEIVHKHYGESEKHLREVFAKAAAASPAIVFIDEIDSIAPKRDSVEGEVEKRIVAQLLALMDGLTRRDNLIVIAATNLPNSIDPALRRPGRFDREIEIPIPDAGGRRQILDIHTRGMPLRDDVELGELASIAHGYVGADLEALCREAAMSCLRRVMLEAGTRDLSAEVIRTLDVSMDDFRAGLREVEPSAIREVFVERPNVSWDEIGGLGEVKSRLIEAVEWPLRHAGLFREAGVRPPRGILLAGPPGMGKTLLARALASQTEANFISIKGPELMSRFVGESERRLREVFRKARQASPCIIFFDEIDALVGKRGLSGNDPVGDRVIAQFLAEVDGVEQLDGVLVLGATNRRDRLDPALLRPGRFDEVVELTALDEAARREVLLVHLLDRPLADRGAPETLAADLAKRSEGASGAQLAGIVRRAAMSAVRRAVRAGEAGRQIGPEITPDDLNDALHEALARDASGEAA
ncbi:MAG: CDC48 family AAA ATPase [Planctomycetota bacterium]